MLLGPKTVSWQHQSNQQGEKRVKKKEEKNAKTKNPPILMAENQ